MAKRHDENKVLASMARIGKVDRAEKTVTINNALIGIHTWGKIDFLSKYCGLFVKLNNTVVAVPSSSNKENAREAKKAKKEHKLQNKRK